MTQNNVTTTYTYDANNRLWKEMVSGIATTYAYDANGNMISALKGGNAAGAYTYNLFGNQVSFTADDSVFTYYTYRPDGLRHSIDDKVHIWDGANIVADVVGNDVVVYIRGINLIYADDGSRTYYHFNAHGDVVVLTNANGNKTKSYSYNAFGVEYNEATLDDNPFRYCGEYYDKETQTIYLRARYYNPSQGRFTQEDPIRDGYNWYAYCSNNPIMFVDPYGLAPNWSKLANSLLTITVGVLSLAAVVSTGGAATPIVALGLAATATAGVGCVVFGVSDGVEALTGSNPVKEVMGEQAYAVAELGCMMVASAGTNWIATNPYLFNNYCNNIVEQDFSQTDSKQSSQVLIKEESKSAALESVQNLPLEIQKNVKGFFKSGSNKYTDFSVIQECDGSYTVSMTKPGDVPGSYAVYTKTVSASGDTTSLTQIAYDKNGEIVHYHDKFNE